LPRHHPPVGLAISGTRCPRNAMTVVLATARGSTAASGPGFSPVVLVGLVAPVGLVDLAAPPASDGSSARGAESSPAGLRRLSAFHFRGSPARGRQKSRRPGEDTPKAPRAFADPLRLPALAYGDEAPQHLDVAHAVTAAASRPRPRCHRRAGRRASSRNRSRRR
jgi:hypothetical protein